MNNENKKFKLNKVIFTFRKRGFTLVELLAVIVILGVVLAISIPTVMNYTKESKKRSYVLSAKGMGSYAKTYRVEQIKDGKTFNTDGYVTFADKDGNVLGMKQGCILNLKDIDSSAKIDGSGFVFVYKDGEKYKYALYATNGQYVINGVDLNEIETSKTNKYDNFLELVSDSKYSGYGYDNEFAFNYDSTCATSGDNPTSVTAAFPKGETPDPSATSPGVIPVTPGIKLVTFDAYGLTPEANPSSQYIKIKDDTKKLENSPVVPTRAGYTFDGWKYKSTIYSNTEIMTVEFTEDNPIVEATWSVKSSDILEIKVDTPNSGLEYVQFSDNEKFWVLSKNDTSKKWILLTKNNMNVIGNSVEQAGEGEVCATKYNGTDYKNQESTITAKYKQFLENNFLNDKNIKVDSVRGISNSDATFLSSQISMSSIYSCIHKSSDTYSICSNVGVPNILATAPKYVDMFCAKESYWLKYSDFMYQGIYTNGCSAGFIQQSGNDYTTSRCPRFVVVIDTTNRNS